MAVTTDAYRRAVSVIDSVSWRGMRPGLERTLALLHVLDDPHHGLRGVLVGGTNGKGSVCALVESVLRAAGHSTVLLTKPHLSSFCERIACDGEPVSEEHFAALIDDVSAAARGLPDTLQPTGFELLTVAGVLEAARRPASMLVCEVGMGGRLDSTNVLDLGVCVITNVDLDHREHLGDSITAIATEKAAIIKAGDTAVTTAEPPAHEVIRARCAEVGAGLVDARRAGAGASADATGVRLVARFAGGDVQVRVPLRGSFQVRNAAAAISASEALRARGVGITAEDVRRGCSTVRWRARMQWIDGSPPVVVDSGHNPAGMRAAVAGLREIAGGRRVVAVFAAMRDKEVDEMISALEAVHPLHVVVTAPAVERAWEPTALAGRFRMSSSVEASVGDALGAAQQLAGTDGLVFVCGSVYLAGEALEQLAA